MMAEILLVDDNPADIDLTRDVLGRSARPNHVRAVNDGSEAMAYVRKQNQYRDAPTPDLILLDLNLPRKDGRAVLAEIKSNPALRKTPIVIFSTSQSWNDITGSYGLGANSYVKKPGNLDGYIAAINAIDEFWLGCAHLPGTRER